MKRMFALLLSVTILLSFTACGGSQKETQPAATVPVTVPVDVIAAPTEAATQPSEAPAVLPDVIQLVDNENVTVVIDKIEHNDHTGMQLHIQCVNKTDRALMFSLDMVSVCGFMYDPMWAEEVSGGKTSISTVYFDTYALEQLGVASVDEITFTLRVYDSENWMEVPLVGEVFTIYPTGLTAETLQLPQRTPTDGQVVIAENENFRFVIEWADAEDASKYTVYVYAENKTDRNLMYAWDAVSVNGYMVDPFWATIVAAGKKTCSQITFYRSELADNGIEDVTDIEFTLLISDYDDWEASYLLEETFTYQP